MSWRTRISHEKLRKKILSLPQLPMYVILTVLWMSAYRMAPSVRSWLTVGTMNPKQTQVAIQLVLLY